MGIFGSSKMMTPQTAWDQMPAPPKQGGGFFGQNGAGRMIAGVLGDALLRNNGSAPIFLPLRMQQMQLQQQQEQDAAQRETDFADWTRKQQWALDHQKPVNNDTVNDVNWYVGATPEQRAAYHAMHPQFQSIHNADGTVTVVPMGGMGMGTGIAPPTAPVGKLTPISGGASQASGPFANPPAHLRYGNETSGRRTVDGNAAVGGVPNSAHLSGQAIDYSGPDLGSLLGEVQQLPGLRRAFIHKGNHVHAEGNWNVPYFGKRGTIGQR